MSYLRLIRKYSTQATKLVRPQIQVFGVAGKYLNALYSAASKTKKLDQVEKDLDAIKNLLEKDMKFQRFLSDPLITPNNKKNIMAQALKDKLKFTDITQNFLNIMIENNRASLLLNIARNYKEARSLDRDEMECVVYTSEPLTDQSTKKEIEETVKKFTKKALAVKMKVDPNIIGGMIIDFGGRHYIDLSLRKKLKAYTDVIRETI